MSDTEAGIGVNDASPGTAVGVAVAIAVPFAIAGMLWGAAFVVTGAEIAIGNGVDVSEAVVEALPLMAGSARGSLATDAIRCAWGRACLTEGVRRFDGTLFGIFAALVAAPKGIAIEGGMSLAAIRFACNCSARGTLVAGSALAMACCVALAMNATCISPAGAEAAGQLRIARRGAGVGLAEARASLDGRAR